MRGQQTRLRPMEVKVELSDNPTPQRQKIESGIKFLSRWLLNWPDDVTVMFMDLLVFSLPTTLSAFGSCVGCKEMSTLKGAAAMHWLATVPGQEDAAVGAGLGLSCARTEIFFVLVPSRSEDTCIWPALCSPFPPLTSARHPHILHLSNCLLSLFYLRKQSASFFLLH